MYTCKHFRIEELVPPGIVEAFGQDAWNLLTDDIKVTADRIREYFDLPMIINKKPMIYRGYRTANASSFNPKSQHAIGNAIDFHFNRLPSLAVRNEILSKPDDRAFRLIGGVEDFPGMSWVHVDCRKRVDNKILVFGR